MPSIIGEFSPAKSGGLTFTLASLMPVLPASVFMVILLLSGLASQEGVQETDWYLYINYLLTPVSFAAVACLLLRWRKTPVKQAIRKQKCQPKYLLIASLMQFGLLSLSELNALFLEFLALFGYVSPPVELPSMDGFGLVGVLFVIAVLPAVFEEVIFRGLLLKGMKDFSWWQAVLVSGALFALYHKNPAQTVYQFCCGAAFALVAVKAGSILPTVLSHFLNNAYIVIMTKLGVSAFPTPVYVVLLALEAISLLGAVLWLVLDKKEEAQAVEKTERKTFWTFAIPGIAYCGVMWLSVLFSGLL